MTKLYATLDSDGPNIIEGAHIEAFDSRESAVEYLLSAYRGGDWDRDSAVIEEGTFGDCWIKDRAVPKVGDPHLSPFSFTQIIVQHPGQHPGGAYYWITPRQEILVISQINEIEDTKMTAITDINGKEIDFDAAVMLMDDDLREELHAEGIENEQEFLERYAAAHQKRFSEEFAPYTGGNW